MTCEVMSFLSDTALDAALSPSRLVGWRSVLYAAGAVCCSVMQSDAECRSVLQFAAVRCSAL